MFIVKIHFSEQFLIFLPSTQVQSYECKEKDFPKYNLSEFLKICKFSQGNNEWNYPYTQNMSELAHINWTF